MVTLTRGTTLLRMNSGDFLCIMPIQIICIWYVMYTVCSFGLVEPGKKKCDRGGIETTDTFTL